MRSVLLILCVLPLAAIAWDRNCINKPVGFGYKTTGGAGGRTVVPKNIKELTTYLSSNEKLIIDLTTTFDFTESEGWLSSTGCYYKKCKSGFQESLARFGICEGRSAVTVKYAKAGTTELVVSSFKTVMSSNGKGTLKGKGIRIKNADQVIIRDITISDINAQVIWGGDAISFDKCTNVWIHRVTVARVGRQHLVSNQQSNTGITVSSCFFDGSNQHSASCDGTHYWMWLFWGTYDEITLINNHVQNTAGRLPHAGGWNKASNFIHMIGNYMDTNPHNGLEPNSGSNVLCEGNLFHKYNRMINRIAKGGHLALVNTAKEAGQCKQYLGQDCLVNKYSGTKAMTRFDVSVLQAFAKLDRTAISGARQAVCKL